MVLLKRGHTERMRGQGRRTRAGMRRCQRRAPITAEVRALEVIKPAPAAASTVSRWRALADAGRGRTALRAHARDLASGLRMPTRHRGGRTKVVRRSYEDRTRAMAVAWGRETSGRVACARGLFALPARMSGRTGDSDRTGRRGRSCSRVQLAGARDSGCRRLRLESVGWPTKNGIRTGRRGAKRSTSGNVRNRHLAGAE